MNTKHMMCEKCGDRANLRFFYLPWLKRVVTFCPYHIDRYNTGWLRYSSPILSVPFGSITAYRYENEYVTDLLTNTNLCKSNSIARRLIMTGGVEINGKTVGNLSDKINFSDTILNIKIKNKKTVVLLK